MRTAWSTRPREEAFLLNPAFGGRLLLHALIESKTGLPVSVLFLILPLLLHKDTREALPSSVTTSVPVWLARNAEIKVGFALRASQLVQYTKESLLFLGNQKLISFVAADVVTARVGKVKTLSSDSVEVKNCVAAARLMGRWLRSAGTPETLFALFGIRP
jgi:hypothetical protein